MLISACVIYTSDYFQLIVYKKIINTGPKISLGLVTVPRRT